MPRHLDDARKLQRIERKIDVLIKKDESVHKGDKALRKSFYETVKEGNLRKSDIDEAMALGVINSRERSRLHRKLRR